MTKMCICSYCHKSISIDSMISGAHDNDCVSKSEKSKTEILASLMFLMRVINGSEPCDFDENIKKVMENLEYHMQIYLTDNRSKRNGTI